MNKYIHVNTYSYTCSWNIEGSKNFTHKLNTRNRMEKNDNFLFSKILDKGI